MARIEVTYYAGTWTDRERADIRSALESQELVLTEDRGAMASFTVSEAGGLQKGVGFLISPQLLIDAHEVLNDAAALGTLITSIILICQALIHKAPAPTVQVLAPSRIYIIQVGDKKDVIDAAQAIPKDFAITDAERHGDMTWRDGQWKTVEELHGVRPTGPRQGRPPNKKGRARKGRPGQTR
jgi:hypothetical protein